MLGEVETLKVVLIEIVLLEVVLREVVFCTVLVSGDIVFPPRNTPDSYCIAR